MPKNNFDIIMLLGRPASGKSEVIDYLKKATVEETAHVPPPIEPTTAVSGAKKTPPGVAMSNEALDMVTADTAVLPSANSKDAAIAVFFIFFSKI